MFDVFSQVHFLVRWFHVFAGIVWLGVLYFFNFINIQLQMALSEDQKGIINPQLMPRALWWFRWGAMLTFLSGLVLFSMLYMYEPGLGFGPSAIFSDVDGLTGRAIWILFGMACGTLMWINVWFIIWPAQKKILSAQHPDLAPKLKKRASLFSKINTYLSAPMLFGMLGANHMGGFGFPVLAVAVLVGVVVIAKCYFVAKRVGKS